MKKLRVRIIIRKNIPYFFIRAEGVRELYWSVDGRYLEDQDWSKIVSDEYFER